MSADKLIVRLRYPFRKLLYSLASGTTSFRLISNGPYDVDPALGSTSTPGFSEYSVLYSYNRVVHSHFHIVLSNLESTPVTVYIVHSNTDPGSTGLNWYEFANNAFGQTHMLSSIQAQPSKIINSRIRPSRLVGDRTVNTDQNFVGTSTSNPSDLTYVGVGLEAVSGLNLTNGVWISGYLEQTVEFFDRKNLLTTYRNIQQAQQDHDIVKNAEQKGLKVPEEVQAIVLARRPPQKN